jgi:Fur family transcriptional regulator, zinc uptake regulator
MALFRLDRIQFAAIGRTGREGKALPLRPAGTYIQNMSAGTHDHAACVEHALSRAEAVCAERGARLTALRRRVLVLVWAGHRPRGAYQILDDLREAEGKGIAPLTVYRALEFLEEQGLVHRIESLNAYVGCAVDGTAHRGQFLVCTACGTAIEIDDPAIRASIEDAAARHGFRAETPVVEVRGLCEHCRTEQESR